MKTLIVKKGEELKAARILSNRTDDDFDAVDATVKEVIARVRAEGTTRSIITAKSSAVRERRKPVL